MIVCKFGGSSLCDANNIKNAAQITSKLHNPLIVVSAMGKRFNEDKKITDLLIEFCCKKNERSKKTALLSEFYDRFMSVATTLKVSDKIKKDLCFFIDNTDKFSDEYIISRGEYFTAKIFSAYSKIKFIDSAEFMRFDIDGCFLKKESSKLFNKKIFFAPLVTCGFYGQDENGNIKLFERGGGDITAAYLCSFSDSNYYYNFTDVDGIYDSPPFCKNKNTIKTVNYSDAYFLASHGDNVLNPVSILPLICKNKKVIVKKSHLYSKENTVISLGSKLKQNCFSYENSYIQVKISISELCAKNKNIYDVFKLFMTDIILIEHVSKKADVLILFIKKKRIKNVANILRRLNIQRYNISDTAALHFIFKNKRRANLKTGQIKNMFSNLKITFYEKKFFVKNRVAFFIPTPDIEILNNLANVIKE